MRNNFKITGAQAMDNGITFYSNRHKGYAVIATIDEQNAIKTEWVKKRKHAVNKEDVIFLLSVLPFVVIFAFLIEWASTWNPIYGVRTLLIGYSIMALATFMINIKRHPRRTYMFHSAEHMVLNAFRSTQRVPQIDEIYQFSRFDNTCGTNQTTLLVVNCILMFACSFITNLQYRQFAMILVPILVGCLVNCGYLNFLQKFTTITPTEVELNVAIAGMNEWIKKESI